MKKYPLSSPKERAVGIAFSLIIIAIMGLLLYALRNDTMMLLLVGIGVLLVTIILCLYMLNVVKAVIVYDSRTRVLKVKGFAERTIDLSGVTLVQTITVKSGHVESRSLAFSNAEGAVVAIVPTYFTSNRGMAAEPMAKGMAADLGIEFQANVPEWEYDEDARKAHEIEVAQQQKEDAKKRRAAKAALRQAKMRKKIENARAEQKNEK